MKRIIAFSAFLFAFALVAQPSGAVVENGYGGDPVSCDMHANPGTIEEGGATTLIWYSSDNVVSATLHPKDSSSWTQNVPTEGWWWISGIVDTRTYTLTVEGADGQTANCDAEVIVMDDEQEDPTCDIYADPSTIVAGGGTTLIWESSDNVVSAILHPTGSSDWTQSVSADGSWWISGITDSRSYSLTVETAGGLTTTCDAPIIVEESVEAPTCEMYADPSTIEENGGTTLIWEGSDNVINAKLHPTGSTDYFANVTPSGSWWISGITDSRSYSVTVEAVDGQTATCDAPIIVE